MNIFARKSCGCQLARSLPSAAEGIPEFPTATSIVHPPKRAVASGRRRSGNVRLRAIATRMQITSAASRAIRFHRFHRESPPSARDRDKYARRGLCFLATIKCQRLRALVAACGRTHLTTLCYVYHRLSNYTAAMEPPSQRPRDNTVNRVHVISVTRESRTAVHRRWRARCLCTESFTDW